MTTLTVTEVPESHRGPVFFFGGPGWPDGQAALTCFFVGFRTDFVISVRVSVASAGVLALEGLRSAGPQGRKPPRGRTLSAP